MREWNHLMADDGWTGIDWPVEHGGRGLGLAHQVVLAEELDRARAPSPLNPIGLANIAPSIMTFGTEEQTERFLRPMLRGDEIWCQGFSEPDAGSDLASLATRGRRDGDDWVITGQKVWNTYGQLADWCELLVRTDPTASKHHGITCFLVDMRTPGIEVRPLRTATGDEDFCELFFDEVRVPDSARLGPEGDGWMVAMATLSFERSGVANLHIRTRRQIRELMAAARAAGRADDPVVRQELARALHRRRAAAAAVRAGHHPRPAGPGPRARGQPDQAGVEPGGPAAPPGGHPDPGDGHGDSRAARPRRRPTSADWGTAGHRGAFADHRRRHHRGEQEHRGRARPGPPPRTQAELTSG